MCTSQISVMGQFYSWSTARSTTHFTTDIYIYLWATNHEYNWELNRWDKTQPTKQPKITNHCDHPEERVHCDHPEEREMGWKAYGLFRVHRYHPELNWSAVKKEEGKRKAEKGWLTRPLSKFLSQAMSSMSSSSTPLMEDLDPRSMDSVCNRGRVGSKAGLTTPSPGPWYSVLLPDMADGDSVCHTMHSSNLLFTGSNKENKYLFFSFSSFCFLCAAPPPPPPRPNFLNLHFWS